jgi:hypothetical protein
MVMRIDADGLRTDAGVAGATGIFVDGRRNDGGDFFGSSSGIVAQPPLSTVGLRRPARSKTYGAVVTHVLPAVVHAVSSTLGGGTSLV